MDFKKEVDSEKKMHFDFSQIKIDYGEDLTCDKKESSDDDSSEEILVWVSEAFGFQHFLLPKYSIKGQVNEEKRTIPDSLTKTLSILEEDDDAAENEL